MTDSSDYLPSKAYIIPHQNIEYLMNSIDDAIERTGPSEKEKEAAAMRIRSLFHQISKDIHQCNDCGRIYIEDLLNFQKFIPDDHPTSTGILASKKGVPFS